ncbi:hypothetical protein EMIT0196MI5_10092 [Pseudomonas sp. IT-196MI5]
MCARCSVSCLPAGAAPVDPGAASAVVDLAAAMEVEASAAAGAVSAGAVRPAAGDNKNEQALYAWHY